MNFFDAGASRETEGSGQLMVGEASFRHYILEQLPVVNENLGPAFDQTLNLLVSIRR